MLWLGLTYLSAVAVNTLATSRLMQLQLGNQASVETFARLRVGVVLHATVAPWTGLASVCLWTAVLWALCRLTGTPLTWPRIAGIALGAQVVYAVIGALTSAGALVFLEEWRVIQEIFAGAPGSELGIGAFLGALLAPASVVWLLYVRRGLVRDGDIVLSNAWVLAIMAHGLRSSAGLVWTRLTNS